MLKQRNQDFPLDLSKKLNIAHINLCTEAEGPYSRMAIWFQGCNIMCEGCCNPELQEIKISHLMTVQDVVDIAVKSKTENGIEGVTFLGGEPTMQEGLVCLAQALAQVDLGTILFTGRKYENLSDGIKENMDLIVDGRYEAELFDDERNLVGSKNQQITCISDRYKTCLNWFMNIREKKIEINIGSTLFINGDVI